MESIGEKELEQVRAFITQVHERFRLPGISVAVSVNGVCIEVAVGVSSVATGRPLGPDDYFELGCINKFLTGLCVLDLAANAQVDLAASVASYLPEVAGNCGSQVTLDHLLSHSGGYQGENMLDSDVLQDLTYPDFARSFRGRPMQFVPGTTFDYSHSAAVLLGEVVTRVSDMNPAQYANRQIFSRLGIVAREENTTVGEGQVAAHTPDPQSGLLEPRPELPLSPLWRFSLTGTLLRMSDLVQLGAALLGRPAILTRRVSELLFQPKVRLPAVATSPRMEERFYQYERGCARYPTGVRGIRSTSVGSTCALRMDPERGIAIAVGINSTSGYLRDLIASKLWNALLPQDLAPLPQFSSPANESFELGELDGVYHGAQYHSLQVRAEDGRLSVRIGHNPAVAVDTTAIVASMTRNASGYIVPAEGPRALEIGFFRDARQGEPCLMVGVNAYRKSEAEGR